MAKKLVGAVVVLLLVVIGAGVWYFVIRDDSVEKATTECEPGPCEASRVDSVDGTWAVVPAESRGTIVITETIGGVADHQVEGRTGGISGSVEVAGTSVTEAAFTVDMTALEFTDAPPGFDVANRARAMEGTGLQTEQFPEATFTLTGPIDLGDDLTSGDPVTAEATGDLTIHGETNPVTFTVEVTADGETFRVSPTEFIPVDRDDYGLEVQAPGFVADIAEAGSFDFLLVLERASR